MIPVIFKRLSFQLHFYSLYVVSETGSPITGTCVGLGNELYPEGGVAGKPVPGFNGQLSC